VKLLSNLWTKLSNLWFSNRFVQRIIEIWEATDEPINPSSIPHVTVSLTPKEIKMHKHWTMCMKLYRSKQGAYWTTQDETQIEHAKYVRQRVEEQDNDAMIRRVSRYVTERNAKRKM